MWFSGLRGAMAYALALQASTTLAVGPVILVTTLVYSLITILGLGTALYPFLNYMDVKNKPNKNEIDSTPNCSNKAKAAISRFDTYYFSPLFIKDRSKIEDRN
jgi:NhaP-type Na+/H+ or K+/H+ antiporter